jgi:hypothetical protein
VLKHRRLDGKEQQRQNVHGVDFVPIAGEALVR